MVKITGVELGLIQAPVFEDGKVRLQLVPSYRFTGHFDNGTAWETSVIALHPDAIAPPPDYPVTNDLRGRRRARRRQGRPADTDGRPRPATTPVPNPPSRPPADAYSPENPYFARTPWASGPRM